MAKTSGNLRGGNKSLSNRLNNHINSLSLSEIGVTEKQFDKIKNPQFESNDSRFERLIQRVGKDEAKTQLTDGVSRILDKNDKAEQYHKSRIAEANKAIKNPKSTPREVSWAKRDLKDSQEQLMKTRADLLWFRDNVL